MSFYKNTNTNIEYWMPSLYYKVGSIVRYKDSVIEVRPTSEIGIWNMQLCKDKCAFYEMCKASNMVNTSWARTRCGSSHRDDEKSIYFKKINFVD